MFNSLKVLGALINWLLADFLGLKLKICDLDLDAFFFLKIS